MEARLLRNRGGFAVPVPIIGVVFIGIVVTMVLFVNSENSAQLESAKSLKSSSKLDFAGQAIQTDFYKNMLQNRLEKMTQFYVTSRVHRIDPELSFEANLGSSLRSALEEPVTTALRSDISDTYVSAYGNLSGVTCRTSGASKGVSYIDFALNRDGTINAQLTSTGQTLSCTDRESGGSITVDLFGGSYRINVRLGMFYQLAADSIAQSKGMLGNVYARSSSGDYDNIGDLGDTMSVLNNFRAALRSIDISAVVSDDGRMYVVPGSGAFASGDEDTFNIDDLQTACIYSTCRPDNVEVVIGKTCEELAEEEGSQADASSGGAGGGGASSGSGGGGGSKKKNIGLTTNFDMTIKPGDITIIINALNFDLPGEGLDYIFEPINLAIDAVLNDPLGGIASAIVPDELKSIIADALVPTLVEGLSDACIRVKDSERICREWIGKVKDARVYGTVVETNPNYIIGDEKEIMFRYGSEELPIDYNDIVEDSMCEPGAQSDVENVLNMLKSGNFEVLFRGGDVKWTIDTDLLIEALSKALEEKGVGETMTETDKAAFLRVIEEYLGSQNTIGEGEAGESTDEEAAKGDELAHDLGDLEKGLNGQEFSNDDLDTAFGTSSQDAYGASYNFLDSASTLMRESGQGDAAGDLEKGRDMFCAGFAFEQLLAEGDYIGATQALCGMVSIFSGGKTESGFYEAADYVCMAADLADIIKNRDAIAAVDLFSRFLNRFGDCKTCGEAARYITTSVALINQIRTLMDSDISTTAKVMYTTASVLQAAGTMLKNEKFGAVGDLFSGLGSLVQGIEAGDAMSILSGAARTISGAGNVLSAYGSSAGAKFGKAAGVISGVVGIVASIKNKDYVGAVGSLGQIFDTLGIGKVGGVPVIGKAIQAVIGYYQSGRSIYNLVINWDKVWENCNEEDMIWSSLCLAPYAGELFCQPFEFLSGKKETQANGCGFKFATPSFDVPYLCSELVNRGGFFISCNCWYWCKYGQLQFPLVTESTYGMTVGSATLQLGSQAAAGAMQRLNVSDRTKNILGATVTGAAASYSIISGASGSMYLCDPISGEWRRIV